MANRYWVAGGNGLWSSTTNWSTTSGGASGASVPGAADQPVFDLNSGSGTSTLDFNTTNLSFYMTGFTGTLDFGIYTISVTGSGTVFQGATTATVLGTKTINVTNSGSTATTIALPGANTEANTLSFNFTSGTYALSFLNALGTNVRNVDFTGFAGTWNARNQAVTIYGNLKLSTGMTLTASTGVVTLGATSGTQSLTFSGKTFNQINVNGIGGTVFFVDNPSFSSPPILTNGTLDFNSRTIGNQTWTMTTGSVVIKNTGTPGWTFSITQSSGTLTLGSDCVVGGTYTLTAGTLNLAGYALTCGAFSSSNSNARTIAFGSSSITCNTTGGTLWTTVTTTNLTVTGTPVVNISYSGALATTVSSGALSEANSISFNFTAGTYSLTFLSTASDAAKNVDFTGFAGTWAARTLASTIYGNLTLSTGMTFAASSGILTFGATSGTQIITSNGKTIDEPLTVNGVGGTVLLADALTMGSTRALTLNNGTFDAANKTVSGMTAINSNLASGNITIKNLSTSVNYGINATSITVTLGTNISVGAVTLTAGALDIAGYQLTCTTFSSNNANTRTIGCTTGNITCNSVAGGTVWNTGTVTGLTVTGTVLVKITNSGAVATTVASGPLTEAQGISFNFTAGTYTLTFLGTYGYAAKDVDFTGFAGTWAARTSVLGTIYGSLTLSSAAGFSHASSSGPLVFGATSGVQVITSNGKTLDEVINIDGVGGTVRLADALTVGSTRSLNHNNGTLDLNGKVLSLGSGATPYVVGGGTQNLTFNGGTLLNPGVGSTAINNASTNFTTTAGTGVGKISMTGATAKTILGGGFIYNCTLSNDGAGALTLTGANTFTTIANGVQPTAFVFPASTTTTVTNWNVSGTAGNLVTITSSTAGTAATISKASGIVSSNYLSLKDSNATGGAMWYAGANSTNVSGNSGWIFSAAPYATAGNFFLMF